MWTMSISASTGISFDEPHQWRWADVKTADLDDLRLIHVEEHTEREQRP